MKTLDTSAASFEKEFAQIENRFEAVGTGSEVTAAAEKIVADVRKEKDSALFRYTEKFDRIALTTKTVRVSAVELKKAGGEIPKKLKVSMDTAYRNIKAFHALQKEKSWTVKTGRTGKSKVGQIINPLDRVGLYVPGGKASYPSSVLMNAIPAAVAGVKEIAVCSPTPGGETNPAVLYAAYLCGIDEFYRVGGAQAVAAMAYGTESIPKVDKITGPGNAYVAEAKRLVFGKVDIDMIAGPSEICVVADDSADPAWVAADLLSQAEHDEMSWTFLVSHSEKLIRKVVDELQSQVVELPKRDIASKSLMKRFYAVKTASIKESMTIANRLASEHLELSFKGAEKKLKDVRHAGAVFVGHYTPEALGDYMAGPNHVLPTSGTARFFSPLGVYDFVKRTSVISYDKRDYLAIAEKVADFADAEGLTAHARSARIRK